jgi:hypothetical protein
MKKVPPNGDLATRVLSNKWFVIVWVVFLAVS